MTDPAVMFTAHPRPWTVVDEGQRATWHGATMSDAESDLYVIDGYREVVANLGDGDDARVIADGLVALAAAATVEPTDAKVLGCTRACGYVQHAGRLLIVNFADWSVEPGDLSGYGGSVASWLDVNGRAINLPDAPVGRRIIQAVLDAGYDIIDPLAAAVGGVFASGEADHATWAPTYVNVIMAVAEAARFGERVAIIVNVPRPLADLCDSHCDSFDGSVRVFNHPEQVPDGYTILHIADGASR